MHFFKQKQSKQARRKIKINLTVPEFKRGKNEA
jgi:hypothetical protein